MFSLLTATSSVVEKGWCLNIVIVIATAKGLPYFKQYADFTDDLQ